MRKKDFYYEEAVDKFGAGERLDTFLLGFPYSEIELSLSPSRSTLQKWILNGCVRIDSTVCTDKSYKLKRGEVVRLDVTIELDPVSAPPENLDIDIVYRDRDILVIDKPPGISSHPVPTALTGSVVNFLLYKKISLPPTSHPLRPGIVHRLDKNTSGLMVIACTDQSMSKLIEMIKRREVKRHYLALVFGNLPTSSGTVDAPIGRHDTDRKKMAVSQHATARPAVTHYNVLKRYCGFTLVACRLETGRTHQIRVHLSHLGYPVAGDPLYGGRKAQDKINHVLKGIQKKNCDYAKIEETLNDVATVLTRDMVHLLHAAKLEFPHPATGEFMSFKAEPHSKFMEVLGLLEELVPGEARGEI